MRDGARKKVTMSDVAVQLGVSNVTVSNALSGKKGVSPTVRDEVYQKANEMGYKYLKASPKPDIDSIEGCDIGILTAQRYIQISTSFYWELYQKIAVELKLRGLYSIFDILSYEDEASLTISKMIIEKRVSSLIIIGQLTPEYLQCIADTGISCVYLDFYEKNFDVDSIITDNFFDMYLMTDYLIQNGHSRIGFIGNVLATTSIQDRYMGFYKAMIEHRLEPRRDWLISDRTNSGINIDFVLPADMPTAFVCNCDEVGYRFVKFLQLNGYRVPEDISVVGFDNYSTADITSTPRITTVEVNMKGLARAAINAIVKRYKNPSYRAGRVQIGGKIVLKDSVKPIPAEPCPV